MYLIFSEYCRKKFIVFQFLQRIHLFCFIANNEVEVAAFEFLYRPHNIGPVAGRSLAKSCKTNLVMLALATHRSAERDNPKLVRLVC